MKLLTKSFEHQKSEAGWYNFWLEGGFFRARDSAAEKPDQGEVLAVGPGKKNDKGEISPMAVKVGDRVLFGKYSGQTVKVAGDELLVMKEDDLFAVVEK